MVVIALAANALVVSWCCEGCLSTAVRTADSNDSEISNTAQACGTEQLARSSNFCSCKMLLSK